MLVKLPTEQADLISTDVVGKVNNLPLRANQAPIAIFEAVVNSIHSIWERNTVRGRVIIEYQPELNLIQDMAPVSNVCITDNGAGFTSENFASFKKAETTHKTEMGGRGVGRFTWLKCFDRAEVTSTYFENGRWRKRRFDFVLDQRPLRVFEEELLDEADEPSTVIWLKGLKEKYQQHVPRVLNQFAKKLIDHHVSYFVGTRCPEIILRETYEHDGKLISNERVLNNQFDQEFVMLDQEISFKVAGEEFLLRVLFVRLESPGAKAEHKVLWCGNERTVIEHPAKKYVEDLDKEPLHYGDPVACCSVICVVQGKFLDRRENINNERTAFNFPEKRSVQAALPSDAADISQQDIREAIAPILEGIVAPYLKTQRDINQWKLIRFISERMPQYSALATRYPDKVRHLNAEMSPQKLDLELHKLKAQLTTEAKEQMQEYIADQSLAAKPLKEGQTPEEAELQHQQRLAGLLTRIKDISQSDLTSYVLHRKLVIDLLKDSLQRSAATGKYALEDQLHSIVFPIRTTSEDDKVYDMQNLWLVDERLSYHRFLSSDKFVDPENRPDVLVGFDERIAYTEGGANPHTSFVIVEFKRPMRNDLRNDEDPVTQTLRYVESIRSGRAKTHHGRPITTSNDCRFQVYIICDVTDSVEQALRGRGFKRTIDGEGYYFFNENYNAAFEVVSYDKLVSDAVKRNQVFFDKLGIRANGF